MPPRIQCLAWLAPLLLGACGQAPDPAPSPSIMATASSGMEFRGERPCVDCDGIVTWLRLEHDVKTQRYRMVEAYLDGDQLRRFEDDGDWVAKNELLRLRSRAGGERVYARLADGRLQARGAHGQPLPAAADDVMSPITFDTVH